MDVSERHIELAEAAVELERSSTIAGIRAELTQPGEPDCINCDAPIPLARRQAMASAERCIACQNRFERSEP